MMYLAIGRRRLGKTTLAYSMAKKCPYRVIFDPRGQIHSEGVRVHSPAALAEVSPDMTHPKDPLTEIVVTPDANPQAMFDACAALVKDWGRDFQHKPPSTHRLMFLIDEVRFIDPMRSAAFEYVMRATPPDLIHVVITGHRPSDIKTDVRAISDHWLMFRCTQEHDLKVIRERCGDRVARHVSQLKPHQFIHWDDGATTAYSHVNPAAWFVPLRTSPPTADSDDDSMLPAAEPGHPTGDVDSHRLFEP